tara:strand:+ start:218 stop:472 length:255 start_codon:yes stop_codon:yes gene_type:complete
MRKLVNDWLADIGETSIFADGFDDAIIGLSYDPLAGSYRVCYSIGSCHECLMKYGDMSLDEAIEYFEYNVIGSYMGPETPIFVI